MCCRSKRWHANSWSVPNFCPIKHTCSWRDKLIALWTLNRQAKIFLHILRYCSFSYSIIFLYVNCFFFGSCLFSSCCLLNHFTPLVTFYFSWKHQKVSDFSMFSRVIQKGISVTKWFKFKIQIKMVFTL